MKSLDTYNSHRPWYHEYLTPQLSNMYFVQDGIPTQTYEKVTRISKSLRWTYHLKIPQPSYKPPKFKQIGVRKLIHLETAKLKYPEYFI